MKDTLEPSPKNLRFDEGLVQKHRRHCHLFPWGAGYGKHKLHGQLAFASQ
jgi:hypothetical protein